MDLWNALIDWDDKDDENGNTAHIAEHDLTPEEVESALCDEHTSFDLSDSSGRPIAFGTTDTGRFIAVVFEILSGYNPLPERPVKAVVAEKHSDKSQSSVPHGGASAGRKAGRARKSAATKGGLSNGPAQKGGAR